MASQSHNRVREVASSLASIEDQVVRSLAAISTYAHEVMETGDTKLIVKESKMARMIIQNNFSKISTTLGSVAKDLKTDKARLLQENCRLKTKISELECKLAQLNDDTHSFHLTRCVQEAEENEKVKPESSVHNPV